MSPSTKRDLSLGTGAERRDGPGHRDSEVRLNTGSTRRDGPSSVIAPVLSDELI